MMALSLCASLIIEGLDWLGWAGGLPTGRVLFFFAKSFEFMSSIEL